ncbi:hypothetical protein DFH09DRAFT_1102756 [Mycena vulgaris]|nr:hypothetical protein DFH09DRAFT_1102756 [Mycena vulgaris]
MICGREEWGQNKSPRHTDGDKAGLRQGWLEEKTKDGKAKSGGTKWKETIENECWGKTISQECGGMETRYAGGAILRKGGGGGKAPKTGLNEGGRRGNSVVRYEKARTRVTDIGNIRRCAWKLDDAGVGGRRTERNDGLTESVRRLGVWADATESRRVGRGFRFRMNLPRRVHVAVKCRQSYLRVECVRNAHYGPIALNDEARMASSSCGPQMEYLLCAVNICTWVFELASRLHRESMVTRLYS